MRAYALILNERVQNMIAVDESDLSAIPFLERDFDAVLDVSDVEPIPSIGWLYINSGFSAPPQERIASPYDQMDPDATRSFATVLNGVVNGMRVEIAGMLTESYLDGIRSACDYLVDITDEEPSPQIGWVYDGTSFSQP